MRVVRTFALAAIAAVVAVNAQAAYPDRPIEIVVPYAAGGAADMMARMVAKLASESLANPVVVVNKPGGNTISGTVSVVSDKPDGYKILMVTNTNIVLNPLIYRRMAYSPNDLRMISLSFEAPLVLLANNRMPFSTVTELRDYAIKNPDRLNYSSASATGPLSLTVERLKRALNFQMFPIAYSGGAPALMAVLSGDVQVGVDAFSGSMSQIRAKKVKALAVTSPERLPVMPDIPTVAETVPGFRGSVWYGFAVHAKTSPDIEAKLKVAIDKAAADPNLIKTLTEQGLIVHPARTKEEIEKFVADDRANFSAVIRDLDIKL